MGVITWNGVDSDQFGILVEKYPAQNGTARRYTAVTVPGRNGTVIIDQDAYENQTQSYEIAFVKPYASGSREIRQWLLGPAGYQTLADSYDPGYFRRAYFVGPLNIENVLNSAGRATISFSCQPERWLDEGETVQTFTGSGTIENPTENIARPTIVVKTGGTAVTNGTVTIGDAVITVSTLEANSEIVIDCSAMDASKDGDNVNTRITLTTGAWPELGAGDTEVDMTSFASVDIIPHWWSF